ncbi:hypothetical protein [Alishewanella sp. HL-SH06]|uniref:hypothetical protein n=1 Tax=Alishewanella sp. HL-SH06 TaxID=3461144 RepID=UPI0040424240
MQNNQNDMQEPNNAAASDDAQAQLDQGRRDLLKKLGKAAAFAPVSIALVSMEAKACSFSC